MQCMIIFFVLLLFSNCNGQQEKAIVKDTIDPFDQIQWTILPEDYNLGIAFKKYSRWTPSKSDIVQSEEAFIKCLNNQKHRFNYSLNNYTRQYAGLINDKGQKILWINFFCDEPNTKKDWKQSVVAVEDGGDCYFELKLNLDTKTCFDWHINPEE